MNARYYTPNTNRMLTPDEIVPDPANPQSYNRYSYVNNNPLRYLDPSGHALACGANLDEGCEDGVDDELGKAAWITYLEFGQHCFSYGECFQIEIAGNFDPPENIGEVFDRANSLINQGIDAVYDYLGKERPEGNSDLWEHFANGGCCLDVPISFPGSSNFSNKLGFLDDVENFGPTSGQCTVCARRVVQAASASGSEAQVYRVTAPNHNFLTVQHEGKIIQLSRRVATSLPYHDFTVVDGVAYDSLTGSTGMPYELYWNTYFAELEQLGWINTNPIVP